MIDYDELGQDNKVAIFGQQINDILPYAFLIVIFNINVPSCIQ